jgi:RNA polymerase sigma-70 factor (ECF subfamily)
VDLGAAVAAARQGDEDGFRLLWRHFQPRLLRFLKVYAGQDVEDLASETWLQVVRDLRQFRGDETTFAAWLFTIARRRAIDAQRARQRRPATLMDLRAGLAHPSLDVPAAEEVLLGVLSTRTALSLIASLPADQAEAVALSVLGGLSAAEISKVLDITAGAVRVRVHRGLRRLEGTLAHGAGEISA